MGEEEDLDSSELEEECLLPCLFFLDSWADIKFCSMTCIWVWVSCIFWISCRLTGVLSGVGSASEMGSTLGGGGLGSEPEVPWRFPGSGLRLWLEGEEWPSIAR